MRNEIFKSGEQLLTRLPYCLIREDQPQDGAIALDQGAFAYAGELIELSKRCGSFGKASL